MNLQSKESAIQKVDTSLIFKCSKNRVNTRKIKALQIFSGGGIMKRVIDFARGNDGKEDVSEGETEYRWIVLYPGC